MRLMTTVPVFAPRHALRERLGRKMSKLDNFARGALTALVRPAKPVAANLAKIPLTVAAIGILDGNVISWNVHIGLLITAASLVLLEHLLADE